METKISDCIGFCYGVEQAVELSRKALRQGGGRIFSIGPLIHNPQVVGELSEKGLTPLDNIESLKGGTVIISSHGAGAGMSCSSLKAKGLKVIDATCPFVKKIQGYVKRLYNEGYRIVIIGQREHPEVKGLLEFTDAKALVIKDKREAGELDLNDPKVGVVAQSTYSEKAFLEIVSILSQKPFLELIIYNTICRDTLKRQEAARRLARSVDMMIIIGGKKSANTGRLAEVCRETGRPTYHIEDCGQLEPGWFAGKDEIGIASGASTPDCVVRAVVEKIKRRNN